MVSLPSEFGNVHLAPIKATQYYHRQFQGTELHSLPLPWIRSVREPRNTRCTGALGRCNAKLCEQPAGSPASRRGTQTGRKQSWSSGPGPRENTATARQLRLQGSRKEGCGCAIIMVKGCQELRGCVLNSETHIPVTSCVGHTGVSWVSWESIRGRQHVSM